jgi:ATP-dependent DNA helicase RecG
MPLDEPTSARQLHEWLGAPEESPGLEFKEAKGAFAKPELYKYCTAIANEGGGRLILGVTNAPPRRVVGTKAYTKPHDAEREAHAALGHRVRFEVTEVLGPRVIVVHVPSRPTGQALAYERIRWMRAGNAVVPMTDDVLRRIFAEAEGDFSARTCAEAAFDDLDPGALATFAARWTRGQPAPSDREEAEQLLVDSELMAGGELTYAGLILLATRQGLGRHLPQSEVVFEYRPAEGAIRHQQREAFREGFLVTHDRLWALVNLRNTVYQHQEGLFRHEIPTFAEPVVREAIINAVSHRDYRQQESVFVRQSPEALSVESPGGLPEGITPANMLFEHKPRNRRLADVMARCGLGERSNQGVRAMFAHCLGEGKLPPDYSESDAYRVLLRLSAEVRHPAIISYAEDHRRQTGEALAPHELLVLGLALNDEPVPRQLKLCATNLVAKGALERQGRGRGVRYLLPERYYEIAGRRGAYARAAGLDKGASRQRVLEHIADHCDAGSPFSDLCRVLPALSKPQVKVLVAQLRQEGRIHARGRTRAALWFPGAEPPQVHSGGDPALPGGENNRQ